MYNSRSIYRDTAEEGRYLLSRKTQTVRALRRFVERAIRSSDWTFHFSTWTSEQAKEMLTKFKADFTQKHAPGVRCVFHVSSPTSVYPLEKWKPVYEPSDFLVIFCRHGMQFDTSIRAWTLPSLKDWQLATEYIVDVMLALHRCFAQVNEFLTQPTYAYRGLPCSVVPPEALWEVVGTDLRGGSGVLEWATSKADAEQLVAKMKMEPARFKGVACQRYATELDPSDAQVVQTAVFCSNDPSFGELEMLRFFGQEQLVSANKLVLGKSYWVSGPKYALYQFAAENQNVFFSQSPMLGDWHALT